MRAKEFVIEATDAPITAAGWNELNLLKKKSQVQGQALAGSYQLFIPRGRTQGSDKSTPILKPGKATSPPGRNKPQADLWTSTATKIGDKWTSAWAEWTHENMPDWYSDYGFLYRVKPGALILPLNNDRDARRIFKTFETLGRVNRPEGLDKLGYRQFGADMAMYTSFPWDHVVKHFDATTHQGHGSGTFVYGWDVESTAWFDTGFLQLIGKVPVSIENNY